MLPSTDYQKETEKPEEKISQINRKARRLAKKALQEKLNPFEKEMQSKWQNSFEFSPIQAFTLRGKKKRVNDEVFKAFLDDLKLKNEQYKGENLTSFHLKLINCFSISDKSLQYLASHMSTTFKNLVSLELHFSRCNITDHGVGKLISQVGENLKSLQHLGLNFQKCRNVRKSSLDMINSTIINNFPNLTSLSLAYSLTGYITSRQIIDGVCDILRARNELKSRMLLPKELSDLTSCIQKRQKSLEHLKLTEGFQWKFSKKDFLNTLEDISNLKGLKSLDLSLSGFRDFYGNDPDKVTSSLTGLKNLETLKLNFSESVVQEKELSRLITAFQCHLENLTFLHLDLRNCRFIDIPTIVQLEELLSSNSQNLKLVELKLFGCPKIKGDIHKYVTKPKNFQMKVVV